MTNSGWNLPLEPAATLIVFYPIYFDIARVSDTGLDPSQETSAWHCALFTVS